MSKKKWIVLVGLMTLGVGTVIHQKVQIDKREEAQSIIELNQKAVGKNGELSLAIEQLTDASGYLKFDIQEADFTRLEEELAAVKAENEQLIATYKLKSNAVRHVERVEEKLETLRQRFEFQEQVNQLFVRGTAINQGVYNAKLPLKSGLVWDDLTTMQKNFEQTFEHQSGTWVTMMKDSLDAIEGQVIAVGFATRIIENSKVKDAKELIILLNNITADETQIALRTQMTGELRTAVFDQL
ncbi:hypothetical protein [Enterococcus sp.]|uniref:hypothetical protein n=1 Tax=Enterococcus sp. TaxID=35783 RepID=UPI002FCBEE59